MKRTEDPIVSVVLEGFKGYDRTFILDALTLLSGGNGLGKSAVLEAIKFCLTGEVPAGKSNDAAAKFFRPRGGAVTLTTESGRWLRRSLHVDHEQAKVSTTLETQDGKARSFPEWRANEMTLEISRFLELSAAKRREFVLQLVGGGERLPIGDIEELVHLNFVKAVAGDAATLDTDIEDLSEDVAAVFEGWYDVWGVLRTYITDDQSASDLWLKFDQAANDRKNEAKASAVDARKAVKEMKVESLSAAALAARVKTLREAAEIANDELKLRQSKNVLRSEKQRAVESLTEEYEKRLKEHDSAELSLTELGELGEDPGDWALEEDAELGDLAAAIAVTEKSLMTERLRNDKRKDLERLTEARVVLEGQIAEHKHEPLGNLEGAVSALEEMIERYGYGTQGDYDLEALVGAVRGATERCVARWRDRGWTMADQLERRELQIAECTEWLRPFGAESLEQQYKDELKSLRERESEREDARRVVARDSADAREKWSTKKSRIELYGNQLTTAERAADGMRPRIAALKKELEGMPEVDIDSCKAAAHKTEFDCQQAEKALGAVEAYEKAIGRAESSQLQQKVWNQAQRAIRRAREVFVAEIVQPIVGDIRALLELANFGDREVYLTLEKRGQPDFDLGWTHAGAKCSLDALSGGEAVLFVSALALSIAKRTDEKRLLLIEADPLSDRTNLPLLLEGLARMDAELDACVVATSAKLEFFPGWRTHWFDDSGSVECRIHHPRGWNAAAEEGRYKIGNDPPD